MKTRIIIIVGLLIFVALPATWILLVRPGLDPYKQQPETLAVTLGVSVEDYPPTKRFPFGYFLITLQPGMPIRDVHSLARGYEKSLGAENMLRFIITSAPTILRRYDISSSMMNKKDSSL